jgi:hypothetical protein
MASRGGAETGLTRWPGCLDLRIGRGETGELGFIGLPESRHWNVSNVSPWSDCRLGLDETGSIQLHWAASRPLVGPSC